MKLFCTTVTGADENTDINEMIRLAKEYRSLEFGILISESRAGSPRYPSKEWVIEAGSEFAARFLQPRFAYHICGSISRDFVAGILDFNKWDKFMPPLQFIRRMQINVNIGRTEWHPKETAGLIQTMRRMYDDLDEIQVIVQYNHSNYLMWYDLFKFGIAPHILYDASGGRGKEAKKLDGPIAGFMTGYSGGLGPDNIKEALKQIDQVVGNGVTWVDSETKLRTDDNMDLDKVSLFADACAPYHVWR